MKTWDQVEDNRPYPLPSESRRPAVTRDQLVAGVQTVAAIAEAIRELGAVSDGTLYAGLMGKLELGQYQTIIAILVKAGLITNVGHQLRWVGGVPK